MTTKTLRRSRLEMKADILRLLEKKEGANAYSISYNENIHPTTVNALLAEMKRAKLVSFGFKCWSIRPKGHEFITKLKEIEELMK